MAHRLVVPPPPEMVMVPICTWIDIYKIIQVCMCVYVYIYIYIYMCVIYIYVYMHISK